MIVETKKENVCINQLVAKREVTVDIESDTIIPDIKPDILNSINTSGNVFVYKRDVLDGKIKLDGSVNIYVMYMPDEENQSVRGLNTNVDFSQVIEIDEARNGMNCDEQIEIKQIECRVLNGRKINLKVTMKVIVKLYSNENVNIINEIENCPDVQILNDNVQVNSVVGQGNNKVFIKENLNIDDPDNLAEILKINFNIINKENKISYNKVLVKADLEIKMMYLTEDNCINKEEKIIPIMGFVDIMNVSDTNVCETKYTLSNVSVKPNSQEHGVNLEAQIELNCTAYETKDINMVKDLYFAKDDVKINQKPINCVNKRRTQRDIFEINEKIQVTELENIHIYNVDVVPHILSKKILNNKIEFNGQVELNFVFEIESLKQIGAKTVNIDYSHIANIEDINSKNEIESIIYVNKNDFIVQGAGMVDCNIELEIEIKTSNTTRINVIDQIEKEPQKEMKDYSMVVYFVKKEDCLWDIAKKFKSKTSDILRVNEIENEDQLYPGMQLFIPKYTLKKLA